MQAQPFHSTTPIEMQAVAPQLQTKVGGRGGLTAAGRGELRRVRTCKQEANAGGSHGSLVEDGRRSKEKLTCGFHMLASGDRDATRVFYSIRKICTRIVT